ncbi:MAG: ion transporter [Bacteroidales bacterium]|jgi:voltage-gated potassium channel|nr:ion transporter [Bacteroidales bacterium]
MYKKLKQSLYILLSPAKGNRVWDNILDYFLVILISLNVAAVILETVNSIYAVYAVYFKNFERVSVHIFTVEYVLRVWVCTCDEKYKHPVWGRLRYMFSLGALIDLLAFLPFYLPFTSVDWRHLRILRLFMFVRIFKLGRYLSAKELIANVFSSKREELILCLAITVSLIVAASGFVYFAENSAQPEKFSSIPATMWWGVTTLTTVGYGDIYPITLTGKILTSIISILGIGVFALPAGILASGFSEELQKRKHKHGTTCPNCGREIDTQHITHLS